MAASNRFSSPTSARTTQTDFLPLPLLPLHPRLLIFPRIPAFRSSPTLPFLDIRHNKQLSFPICEGKEVIRGSGFRHSKTKAKCRMMARTMSSKGIQMGIYGKSAQMIRLQGTQSNCLVR